MRRVKLHRRLRHFGHTGRQVALQLVQPGAHALGNSFLDPLGIRLRLDAEIDGSLNVALDAHQTIHRSRGERVRRSLPRLLVRRPFVGRLAHGLG